MAREKGVESGMNVLMHPLFLAAVPSLLTWGACRWWYLRQLRSLQQALSAAHAAQDALPAGSSSTVAANRARTLAERALALRLGSLGGAPVLPFLDTSPLTHLAEPDLFGHLVELEPPRSVDRPYLN
jgi:hypothetical protein